MVRVFIKGRLSRVGLMALSVALGVCISTATVYLLYPELSEVLARISLGIIGVAFGVALLTVKKVG